MPPILLLGGGGHASVLISELTEQGRSIEGYVALEKNPDLVIPYFNSLDLCLHRRGDLEVVIAVGNLRLRHLLSIQLNEKNMPLTTIKSLSAIINKDSSIGVGAQILSNAVIENNVTIGSNSIINVAASVHHGSHIGSNTHVAPGARILGNVRIGNNVFIGSNAVISPGVNIGSNSKIGACTFVSEDLPENSIQKRGA